MLYVQRTNCTIYITALRRLSERNNTLSLKNVFFFILCNLPKLDCPVILGNKFFLVNKKIVIALSL